MDSRKTPFNLDNMAFSEKAHLCARHEVYREIFKGLALHYGAPTLQQDAQMGIDRILLAKSPTLRLPVRFFVQERFRRPVYHTFQDITISEWYGNSNTPAELYKTRAHLLVYGFYDEQMNSLTQVVAVWMQPMLQQLALGTLPFSRKVNHAQNKHFLAVPLESLAELHLLAYRSTVPVARAV